MELKQSTRCCFLAILFCLVFKDASANVDESSQACGVGWTYRSGSNFCYQAVLGQPKSWQGAREYCMQAGGDLLSISSVTEQEFVQDMLLSDKNASSEHSFWIGLTDQATEGDWKWSDGTNFSYSNWYSGEPNNKVNNASLSENCVEMVVPWNYTWNDVFCPDKKVFVCKKNDESSQACGVGWTYRSGSNFCYQAVLGQPKSWQGARKYCTQAGGDLLSISNVTEQEFVQDMLLSDKNASSEHSFWIGLTDQAEEGDWKWSDGTNFSYRNWYSKEPSNTKHNATLSENCVEMVRPWDYEWNDVFCPDKKVFICKKNEIDECTAGTDNCDVNAHCTNTAGSFTCSCNTGYSGNGVTCQDINECSSNPCQNGATCINLQNSYSCTCAGGWTGTNCQQDVDECASNPCQNGGQCTNGQNMFTCFCSSGWAGTACQIGYVCNPDNSIDISNLPANYSYFAMQNVTSGPDVECNVTATSTTSVQISGCSKDLDILLTYSTYSGISTYKLHGGKSMTAALVKCSEIQENGTIHNVNNTFEADLIISSDTDVVPTYNVDCSLSTNSTIVGSEITWTIWWPEEYTLEVTSCTAYPGTDDSSSNSVSLISDGGCTVTDELISNFTDHGNGSATATILAFKFYNNDYVFLQCDLKVCPNDSSACDTQCSRMKRSVYKRNVDERAVRDATNDDYYTRTVNSVLRIAEPEMLSEAMKVCPPNQSKSFAFSILLVLLVTWK